MYNFLNDNSIYVVLVIALINWIGLFLYLIKNEKKLNKLEKIINLKSIKSKGNNE
jgi:hypothetical protein